jgi:hypothetical protein
MGTITPDKGNPYKITTLILKLKPEIDTPEQLTANIPPRMANSALFYRRNSVRLSEIPTLKKTPLRSLGFLLRSERVARNS